MSCGPNSSDIFTVLRHAGLDRSARRRSPAVPRRRAAARGAALATASIWARSAISVIEQRVSRGPIFSGFVGVMQMFHGVVALTDAVLEFCKIERQPRHVGFRGHSSVKLNRMNSRHSGSSAKAAMSRRAASALPMPPAAAPITAPSLSVGNSPHQLPDRGQRSPQVESPAVVDDPGLPSRTATPSCSQACRKTSVSFGAMPNSPFLATKARATMSAGRDGWRDHDADAESFGMHRRPLTVMQSRQPFNPAVRTG